MNVWYNLAVNTASSINWVQNPNTIASGVGYAGANVKFAFLNHPRTGRADVSTPSLYFIAFTEQRLRPLRGDAVQLRIRSQVP